MSEQATAIEGDCETSQLVLPLPAHPPRFDRDAFLIAPTNETAWRAAWAWRDSGEPSLIICGPAGSGKSHLATVVAEDPVTKAQGEVRVIDDLPAEDPHAVLAALEEMTNLGIRTILAGRGLPGDWANGLKDLRTRLEAIPRAGLDQPDEALLRSVMSKAFADRQIIVDKAVIEYAAPRLPRTFAAALYFVERADDEAARLKKKVTVALAREIIEAF